MRNSGGLNNSWPHLNFRTAIRLIVLVGLLAGGVIRPAPAAAQDGTELNTLLRATVYVSSVVDGPAGRTVSCVGSGTLVTADGLILTNAHTVVDSERCPVDDIAIALPIRLDEPPVPTYYAEVIASDLGLDLAVLRITRQIDGRLVQAGSLSLPFVELGDSRQLTLDDTITVVGYEGIGDQSVTFSRGTIIGFIAETRGGERSWLKTSATILGSMSGGGAYDASGRLIGIPTTAPASDPEAVLDCRQIQDTNGDGQVDSRDRCIPVGGFVNSLRPSFLARGLVRAAQLGIVDDGHVFSTQVQTAASNPGGEPAFGPIRFTPAVNEAGQPTQFVSQMPAGSNSLYLVFDYVNMRPGLIYELRVTRNGSSAPSFSLSPALWSGGILGLWYIGSAGQVWPNGVYEFTLFIEGRAVQTARITIGGAPQPTPAFSDISFGLLDLLGNDIQVGYVLGVGDVITAQFIYRDMADGLPWSAVWYFGDIEVRRDDNTWQDGPNGAQTINIRADESGLLPGRYRLELYIGDDLATQGDFVLAGGQDGVFAQIFSNVRFSSEIAGGAPSGIVTESFASTMPDLYTFFDWRLLAPGTPWTYRWLVDGDVFFEHSELWIAPETGADFWLHLGGSDILPDGSYTLEILLAGQLFVSETARVGLGQVPVTAGNEVTGVQVSGLVVDADTGVGLPGVLFIVLEAEFSVEDFIWDETQIFARTITDSRGQFQIDRLLPYGEFYSVVILADGYLPVAADGIELDPENPILEDGELEFRLEMNRDIAS
jgi:S1-C subfamily serine protease